MIIEINKEQFKELSEFDSILNGCSVRSRCTGLSITKRNKLTALYGQIYGTKVGCTSCNSNWLKRLSNLYMKHKNSLNNENE